MSTTTENINISIARALTEDEVLMAAVDLTANNADQRPQDAAEMAAWINISADQRPQDAAEIADVIRGIVGTLVAAASVSTLGHPIARIIDEADVCYDPDEIAAEVAWSVTMI